MSTTVKTRQAYRRTDDYTPGTPKVKLVTEHLPAELEPTAVLIKIHAVALNYRDANIANAWSALKGASIGQTVLIQGTGGVSTFALKLARASGLKVILTSSSEEKLSTIKAQLGKPDILTVNYKTNPDWQTEVLRLTNGVGVDLVVENGGSSSLVQSMQCTRRGGTVSQAGYLGGPKAEELKEGINAGSKDDQDELMAAISATQMTFDDIIDSVWSFDKAEEAIEYVWQGKQVGKVVIEIKE
uniref:Enoyl reductase (ER) domain-containing protein n=1 Tax=Bionectria ochroleuca TaxID=29856 RepID=A0A0B7JMW9_BIOOC